MNVLEKDEEGPDTIEVPKKPSCIPWLKESLTIHQGLSKAWKGKHGKVSVQKGTIRMVTDCEEKAKENLKEILQKAGIHKIAVAVETCCK